MRIVSWNVNGIRAVVKKDFIALMLATEADVICLQETKAQDEQVVAALAELEGFTIYSNSAVKKGYSGTAILTRKPAVAATNDLGIAEHDQEGRVIAAEFESFYLVNVYTPNSGSELKRLEYRQQWDQDFLLYLKNLEQRKPVIICGDLNVAHNDIDLARPKENYNKSAGYMQQEINGISNLISAGFVDTFRHFNPTSAKYTWWSYRAGARENDIGWRIDYFLTSRVLLGRIKKTDIYKHIQGSDHCPVFLEIN